MRRIFGGSRAAFVLPAAVLGLSSAAVAAPVPSLGVDLTQPGDPITSTPAGTNAAEAVTELIDNVIGGQGTDSDGSRNKFFVSSSATGTYAITINASNNVDRLGSIGFTTGDDSAERDPEFVSVFGSNTGAFGGEETTIASSVAVAQTATRLSTFSIDIPDAATAFDFYRVTFVTNNSGGAFQASEIQLIAVPEPASLGLIGLGAVGLLARRRVRR